MTAIEDLMQTLRELEAHSARARDYATAGRVRDAVDSLGEKIERLRTVTKRVDALAATRRDNARVAVAIAAVVGEAGEAALLGRVDEEL